MEVVEENSRLEKAFWKMDFAAKDIKDVDELLITYIMMVTKLNDYVTDSEGSEK